jgi:hypothetical protein
VNADGYPVDGIRSLWKARLIFLAEEKPVK